MIRPTPPLPTLLACLLPLATASAAPDPADLLLFNNNDQLHGRFSGISPAGRVLWQREDLTAPIEADPAKLRQIILRGGGPLKLEESPAHIALINGDRIPGRVLHANDSDVTLDTPFAGQITIPRPQIGLIAPQPFGGKLHYHGPHRAEPWSILRDPASDAADPSDAQDPQEAEENEEEQPAEESTTTPEPKGWIFSGAAWYWTGPRDGTALTLPEILPERYILRFDLAWRKRLALSIGFHADFALPPPPNPEKDGENPPKAPPRPLNNPALIFGNAYVLNLFSDYLMVFRSSVDDDGKPRLDRVQTQHGGLRIGEKGSATVEIRGNRSTGEVSLFIDGEFVVQWSEADPGRAMGRGIGFLASQDDTPTRVSEVLIADWNGMPDAARSLHSQDSDIVLLTNGTDRFSGTLSAIENNSATLQGRYATSKIPLTEIAEIHFARKNLATPTEDFHEHARVRLQPIGLLSGKISASGKPNHLLLTHPILGPLELSLDPVSRIDFQTNSSFIDEWIFDF
jgi:hypothetical protein